MARVGGAEDRTAQEGTGKELQRDYTKKIESTIISKVRHILRLPALAAAFCYNSGGKAGNTDKDT